LRQARKKGRELVWEQTPELWLDARRGGIAALQSCVPSLARNNEPTAQERRTLTETKTGGSTRIGFMFCAAFGSGAE
jgi:hypothetical protein